MKRETLTHRKTEVAYRSEALTRGVHHLALNTEDMRMTIDFYVNVIGMPLVHAMKVEPGLGNGPRNRGNPPYEEIRHYFFDMGNDSLLAFFEMPKGAEPKVKRDAIGGMQHVAFAVTPGAFVAIQQGLKAAGVPFDGPVEILSGLISIYFYDPNGIRLEACCQPAAGEKPHVIDSVLQTKAEAASELRTINSVDGSWLDDVTRSLA
jgi:catechol 2,3-dioxygenase-like lactoylglutathione lyase family enzyme